MLILPSRGAVRHDYCVSIFPIALSGHAQETYNMNFGKYFISTCGVWIMLRTSAERSREVDPR